MPDKYKRNIKKIVWPDDSELNPVDGGEIKIINEVHGSYDEDWIVVSDCDGVEIARYNPKYISCILWE